MNLRSNIFSSKINSEVIAVTATVIMVIIKAASIEIRLKLEK